MATLQSTSSLAPEIRSLVRGLRWRIRAYTLLEGLSLVICWVAAMFWIALFFDYVPVLLGAGEMPLGARIFVLVVVGLGTAFILHRWILRRTFARMADHSMAVLLERRHNQFHDALLTAVEMYEHPDHAAQYNEEMLKHTAQGALSHTGEVRLRRVFRWRPLWWKLALAVLLGGSVVAFALTVQPAFGKAFNRLVLLGPEPWQRLSYLEVVGVRTWKIQYQALETGGTGALSDNRPKLVPADVSFADGKVRVARGSNPRLTVRADTVGHQDPGSVIFYWESKEDSGHGKMTSGRKTSDGFQYYTYQREPLKGILETLKFGVRGFDFRADGFEIEVVNSPAVSEVQLIYDRPQYLVDEQRNVFRRVEVPLIAGTQVPRGSDVTISATANKPLQRAYVYDVEAKTTKVIEISGDQNRFSFRIPKLDRNIALEVMLEDMHSLVTERPHLVAFTMEEDKLPEVNVGIRGVGLAVTPDVKFPVQGQVSDDNWLERAWLEIELSKDNVRHLPVQLKPGGFDPQEIAEYKLSENDNVYQWFDFREERTGPDPLTLTPGKKIAVTVKAADRYDLEDFHVQTNPHAGSGDRYELDVVSPDELLIILERRELELRRRFEQVVEEMTQMRDSLLRVKTGFSHEVKDQEPGDVVAPDGSEPGDKELSPTEAAQRALALRQLWVQRAIDRSEQSRGETEGVGVSFLDIVAELENNRVVDTEDRKSRLREQVSTPLLDIVRVEFPELDKRLADLDGKMNANQRDEAAVATAAEHALAQTDEVLLAMDQVLQKMLDLETFNELVELVRGLIDEQEEVIEDTRSLRKSSFFD